jgi:hypothetical protein
VRGGRGGGRRKEAVTFVSVERFREVSVDCVFVVDWSLDVGLDVED